MKAAANFHANTIYNSSLAKRKAKSKNHVTLMNNFYLPGKVSAKTKELVLVENSDMLTTKELAEILERHGVPVVSEKAIAKKLNRMVADGLIPEAEKISRGRGQGVAHYWPEDTPIQFLASEAVIKKEKVRGSAKETLSKARKIALEIIENEGYNKCDLKKNWRNDWTTRTQIVLLIALDDYFLSGDEHWFVTQWLNNYRNWMLTSEDILEDVKE